MSRLAARYQADQYYQRALDALKKRNFDDAVNNMIDAIELVPRNPEYYAARGFIYLEAREPKEAQADFDFAIQINPYEMLAHYGRGIIAYTAKSWPEALAHFQKAFQSNPRRPETLYYLALAYHRAKEPLQALYYMQQAQAIFEAAKDRRHNDASRWVKELQPLAAAVQLHAPPSQAALPVSGKPLQLPSGERKGFLGLGRRPSDE